VALGEPRYVWKIDSAANIVKLGRRRDLETRRFEVEAVAFVGGSDRTAGSMSSARRSRSGIEVNPRPRRSRPTRSGRWAVETDEPVWAAAPGQAAVFYDGDVVLGGGRIVRAENSGD